MRSLSGFLLSISTSLSPLLPFVLLHARKVSLSFILLHSDLTPCNEDHYPVCDLISEANLTRLPFSCCLIIPTQKQNFECIWLSIFIHLMNTRMRLPHVRVQTFKVSFKVNTPTREVRSALGPCRFDNFSFLRSYLTSFRCISALLIFHLTIVSRRPARFILRCAFCMLCSTFILHLLPNPPSEFLIWHLSFITPSFGTPHSQASDDIYLFAFVFHCRFTNTNY